MSQAVGVSRKDFTDQLKGKALKVDDLAKDGRLASVDVQKADLDGDGQIRGEREMKALFKALDAFDKDGSARTFRIVDADGSPNAMQARLDAVADAAQVRTLRSLAMVNGSRGANDAILHVGMRDANHRETDALERRGKETGFNVVKVGGSSSSVTGLDGARYDLKDKREIEGFAKTLGLPAAQTTQIAAAIEKAPQNGRDELAEIAKEWSKGEKGGRVPSRMILSGHSVGGDFFGDRGNLPRESLMDLASAMPRAAGQVEDLHLSGCYCLGRATIEDWRAAFPNVKTVLAYEGAAPKAEGAAPSHQLRWEKATRGRTDTLSRSVASGSVIWSQKTGFDDGNKLPPLKDLRDDLKLKEPAYADHFDGTKTVANHARGPLRDYYRALQRLIEHPDLPRAERETLKEQRAKTIRLIYFDVIVQSFAKENEGVIRDGYSAAKRTAPDFAKLSRKDAIQEIDRFLSATKGASDPAITALRTELEGLKALDPKRVPNEWIP